jgi:ferredoxin
MLKVFYFTGTGNCLAVAKQIVKQFNEYELIMINRKLIEEHQVVDTDQCLVIFPAYGYGLPSMVREFFKKIKINSEYLAVLVTYGTKYGAALGQAKSLSKKIGTRIDGYYNVKSVENYVAIFGFPKPEVVEERLNNQVVLVEEIVKSIKEKKVNKLPKYNYLFSNITSAMFRFARRILALFFKVNKNCTKCGICVRLCPAEAICLKTNKIKFKSSKCQHCQRCLNWCPNKAINFFKIKPNSPRYINPDIKINELFNK